MHPTIVQYEAPPFGVGELWLDGGRVLWSELPRPAEPRRVSDTGHALAERLQAAALAR